MRLYSWVNFYLSSIQQGIQTGHLSDAMTVKYLLESSLNDHILQRDKYVDWITNHKTYITLNGGANEDIIEIYDTLCYLGFKLNLPLGKFCEDEMSLAGIMTCCGIVVPEIYYEAMNYRSFISKFPNEKYNRSHNEDAFYYVDSENNFRDYQCDTPEWRLINLMKSCSLAR